MSEQWGFETRQIHAGQEPDPTTGARAVPIYQTTAYQFRDTTHAANLFALAEIGNIYTRIMNPTQGVFEARMSALEGGTETAVGIPGALAVASGQAAETLAILNLAEPGSHIVSSAALYGGTYNLLHYTLPKLGIDVTFVDDPDDLDAWRAAVQPNTKAFYARDDRQPPQRRARHRGRLGRRPRERRAADRRQHRGHAVAASGPSSGAPTSSCTRPPSSSAATAPRSAASSSTAAPSTISANDKFPGFTEPDPSYHGLTYWPALGAARYIIKARVQLLRDLGPAVTPFNSFLFLQGLETLSLRMERHNANAQAVAEYLAGHAQVESVQFAGLPDSPWHERATRYGQGRGYGSVPAFVIKGGKEAGQKFVEGLELHSHVANIGDVRSLVIHPATTTHSQLTEQEQVGTGVEPGLVRLSVGIETIDDIIADLEKGFAAARS